MEKNENLDICRSCGGRCCKSGGCDYDASDFLEVDYDLLYEALKTGNISIVSYFDFINDDRILYLRSRNVGKDIVDLVSLPSRCMMLKDDGCSYSYADRPRGGRNLIPNIKFYVYCKKLVPGEDIIKSWKPYQEILEKLAYDFSGVLVEEKLERDMISFFADIDQSFYHSNVSYDVLRSYSQYAEELKEHYLDIYQKYEDTYENDIMDTPLIKSLFKGKNR